jgi:hypothetical protein
MKAKQICSHVSRERTVFCGGKCMKLTSINSEKGISEEVEELHSNQRETDTKIVLHTLHASKYSAHDATVTVRSPDTDVFVLLLHCRRKIHKVFLTLVVRTSGDCWDVEGIIADTGEDI